MPNSALARALLSVPDVARWLRKKPDDVRALIYAGEIAAVDLAVRPGPRRHRHLKVRPEAVEEFLRRREALITPAPPTNRRKQSKKPDGWVSYYC
jgi:hypothetical protein